MQAKEIYRPAWPDRIDVPYNHVSYGLPFQKSCPKHVRDTFNSKRVYIVASTSLSKQTSCVKDLETALGELHVGTWVGIRPHTPWDDLVPIINDMREKKADLLVTLGGGSLTDGAKVIVRCPQRSSRSHDVLILEQVYALAQEQEVRTIDELDDLVQRNSQVIMQSGDQAFKVLRSFSEPSGLAGNDITIPIICIPTTLSAGEYTRFGGGTNSTTHHKAICTHPKMLPSLVILDPALTLTTPERIWLSTGVRAVDHAVESMCMLDVPDEVLQSSSTALSMLIPNLLRTKANPNDLDARLQCQIAANIVTAAILYLPQHMLAGASHGIGHQLGPLGVGHGETSCILLPAVLKYNEAVNAGRQAVVRTIIWSSGEEVKRTLSDAGLEVDSSSTADVLDVVFRKLGMPRTLRDVGVDGKEKLSVVARNSINDRCTLANPRAMNREDLVMEVLEMVKG
jgi:alcohol dehydrogenase class IV